MTTTENATPPQKTKVEKAQSYVGLASTTLGVLGIIGTGFVWFTTTFCDGQVEIVPDKEVPSLMVKVTDKKGQQVTYYGKNVWLLPGDYHVEVGVPDKKPTMHADVHVNLWKTSQVAYSVPAEALDAPPAADQTAAEPKKKWWQFWKKSGNPNPNGQSN